MTGEGSACLRKSTSASASASATAPERHDAMTEERSACLRKSTSASASAFASTTAPERHDAMTGEGSACLRKSTSASASASATAPERHDAMTEEGSACLRKSTSASASAFASTTAPERHDAMTGEGSACLRKSTPSYAENKQKRHNATRREKRKQKVQSLRQQVTATMGYDATASMAHVAPAFFAVFRHEADATEAMRRETAIPHDDPTFQTYKRITGEKSCLLYCYDATDKPTRHDLSSRIPEVVMVAKITLFSDMDTIRRDQYQEIFAYLRDDMRFHDAIRSNHALTQGTMRAMGYRAGYEPGTDYGTYVVKEASEQKLGQYATHLRDATRFHRAMARGFYALAPTLHRARVQEARERQLPLLGNSATERPDAIITEETLFSPHVIYTYGKQS
ncbi:MAG: hypothetical protein M1837_003263 [Sclerophora amabilis]|nr:MAG: hypothetical protein M1837_003263 [Sclerophora amabilis]